MEHDKQKQRRKNVILGWSIGILTILFYAATIYFQ
jgi:hypothetical protein